MPEEQNFTFKQQIECVQREIGMREWVYKHRVKTGKMTQEKADFEAGCMKAVLHTLINLNRQYEEATK